MAAQSTSWITCFDLSFFLQRSRGWNVVFPAARFVALLRPEVMTGTALEPPLDAA
jgi:hypothetical protein